MGEVYSAAALINGSKWYFESDQFIEGDKGKFLTTGTKVIPSKYLYISTEKNFHNISKITLWTYIDNPVDAILKIGDATFQAEEKNIPSGNYAGNWFIYYPNAVSGNVDILLKTKGELKNHIIVKEIEVTNLMDDKSENAEYIKQNIEQKDNIVQLNRTISKDYWNTLCLPFDVNKASVNLLLNNPELKEFTREVDGTTMKFRNADSIKAGIPYIIKPSKDVVNPTFHNVIVTATEPKTITDESGNYSFIGTYSPTELKTDGTELFLGDKDYLYKPFANDKTINGIRAFFRIKNNTSQARQSQYSISIDETTFILLPNINTTPLSTQEKIYTLDGRQVHSTYNLKAGIYIKNGKKLYVH
ncbi:hypothetical protein HMPREF9296_1839 [Prevotella disiens FB035-09AN]|uniref:Uncharacterized protein n=1 Tax=Prevotella disiens FB035-09AN TaxID=866771 RepID=E1KTM5_9BACT|nr:hypothetical protein HMPREF9296_1839 [Prevotella disiens FB035-09AN]